MSSAETPTARDKSTAFCDHAEIKIILSMHSIVKARGVRQPAS
jgi:hypothetical protein